VQNFGNVYYVDQNSALKFDGPSHFQKEIIVSILQVSQIFQEFGFRNFIKKLGEMGK
jgi:hypothetical protein